MRSARGWVLLLLGGLAIMRLRDAGGRPARWFSWGEMLSDRSYARRGYSETPTPEQRRAAAALASTVLDPLRDAIGGPLRVSTGWRGRRLNAEVGGVEESQHLTGEAADVTSVTHSSGDLVSVLIEAGIPFDKAIWYAPERGGHLHVSYRGGGPNRREVRHAPASGGYPLEMPPGVT